MSNDSCELCARRPAKKMTFEAHKGFVIFRRSYEISGIFCRDHALEAYAHARGETLKGMWFSPGSLLLGTLSHLVDSAKLIGLPDEVRDAPWVIHKVACPHCNKGVWLSTGPVDCPECDRSFTIGSCPKCSLVHVAATEAYESYDLTCRGCTHSAAAPRPVRNWRLLLFIKAISEVCAAVATADTHITPSKQKTYHETMRALFTFDKRIWEYLDGYFDFCCKGTSDKVFEASRECLEPKGIATLIGIAKTVATADGPAGPAARNVLRTVASTFGIDPMLADPEASARAAANEEQEQEGWWTILQVAKSSTIDEIRAAFRKLASQLHPDTLKGLPEELRKAAEERLKLISSAYEQGLKSAQ